MKRIFFLLLVLIILPISVSMENGEITNVSQNPPDSPAFQRFTDEDGLPLAGVSCLLQDSKGFLWVGTFVGLHRFDGYRFVSFRNDTQDKNSISALNITSIYETKTGQIWIGTTDGLNKYDQATGGFKVYKFKTEDTSSLRDNYIRTIFEDRRGTLWIGTNNGSLNKFDAASESFTSWKFPTRKGSAVIKIVEDKNGGFWVGTSAGLYKFDRETGSVQSYTLSDNLIRSMIIDRAGMIWIAANSGLHKFDPKSEKFTRYAADKNKLKSLNDNLVRVVYETNSGTLWVGTAGGLHRYSKESDDFTFYKHDRANPRSLSEGDILAILEDRNRQLWVGNAGGLNKFNQKTSRFLRFRHDETDANSISRDEILSIYEDKNKILWIGTRINGQSGELNKYDIQRKRFEVVKKLGDAVVYTIYEDRAGKLWFGTFAGLICYDRETDHTIEYKNDPNNPASLGGTTVIAIEEDRAGNLLLGMIGGGMSIFNRASETFTNYKNDPANPQSLSNNRVYAFFEDRFRQIWIGTGDGLDKFDSAKQSFTHYRHDPNNPKSISANEVGTIYEDRSGTLWFGTTTGGLNRYDRETETFTSFAQRDGLPSNDVFEIMEDAQGNLWLCTNRGLARFNIETGSVRNFNVNDGVPNNPFDNKNAFKNSNGEMYFGGQDGFVKFNPKDFTDSDFVPPIYLTDIRIFEQPLKINQNISELKELNLSWRDYVVSFDFAALDFTDPKKLQYQWKLEGFDENWINGGTRRTATYTNLDGGEYVLKVKATNVDGVWSEESVHLKIIVTPPFYRTFWFFVLISAVVGILIWLIYHNRINQLRAISEAQTKFSRQLIASQEAERKRIASELHDGLGQSLAIISNRALMGKSKKNDPEAVAGEFAEISANALEALDEVQEITGNLHPHYLERLGLTKALKSMFIKVSDVLEIVCEIDAVDNLFPKEAEINVYRIVQESLNNIIKHSDASEVLIKIQKLENEIVITVKDDGRGFDTEKVKPTGGGMGLVGLQERTNMLDGRISINSSNGNGTEIRVILPIKNSI